MRSSRVPGLWHGLLWALRPAARGGGISRLRLGWRAFSATVVHRKAMHRWMAVVCELQARGIVDDLPGEYLRAVRPFVHRNTDITSRVVQLIDHADWLETAFAPKACGQLLAGEPLVLADLPAPRGYEYMRLVLRRAPPHAPEGELLLTLVLQRAPSVQPRPQPMEAAVLAFSRFRIDGSACLVIGGVRGQRHPVLRLSPMEVSQALHGWRPAVLMVRVAQELARFWGLRLVGLDPSSHALQGWSYQWNRRHRDVALRIYNSYDALWEHFDAKKGPPGWMVLPTDSDEGIEATALSPEKRARQTRRADYWIRTRRLLRLQMRELLQRPGRDARLSRNTESLTITDPDEEDEEQGDSFDFVDSDARVPARVLETGPGSLP